MERLYWYHTLDLGDGVVTPGYYDHRSYVARYGLPRDLRGATALDIGTASGFFAFELERRGAHVVATELPEWTAHDFGPLYRPAMSAEQTRSLLADPFALAHRRLGSRVERRILNVHDLAVETSGTFDLVFCGSVLLHLTDPLRALWRIRAVTRQVAYLVTTLHRGGGEEPVAAFAGHLHGDTWWMPNRRALERMVESAGFAGWEWIGEFPLRFGDGREGPWQGAIRAWTTPERPPLLAETDAPEPPPAGPPAGPGPHRPRTGGWRARLRARRAGR